MPQQSQHPQTSQATGRFMGQLLIGLSRSTALTVEVFFHRSFGSRYVGSGLWGLFIIFIFSWFFPDENLRPLMWFGATYGVLWLIAVAAVWIRRWRRKDTVHSLYTGRPFLARLLPGWKETSVKHFEALLAILLGYGVHFLNRPLGDYWVFASAVMFLRGYHLAAEHRDRAIAMNDAVVEQQLVGNLFRDMQEP